MAYEFNPFTGNLDKKVSTSSDVGDIFTSQAYCCYFNHQNDYIKVGVAFDASAPAPGVQTASVGDIQTTGAEFSFSMQGSNKDFAIQVWFKPSNDGSDGLLTPNCHLISKIKATKTWGFAVGIHGSKLWAHIGDEDNDTGYTTGIINDTTITPDVWHHAFVYFDRSGKMYGYLDGTYNPPSGGDVTISLKSGDMHQTGIDISSSSYSSEESADAPMYFARSENNYEYVGKDDSNNPNSINWSGAAKAIFKGYLAEIGMWKGDGDSGGELDKVELRPIGNGVTQSFVGSDSDSGGNYDIVTVTYTDHSLTTGDQIVVSGTTNYNGTYSITRVNSTTFTFTGFTPHTGTPSQNGTFVVGTATAQINKTVEALYNSGQPANLLDKSLYKGPIISGSTQTEPYNVIDDFESGVENVLKGWWQLNETTNSLLTDYPFDASTSSHYGDVEYDPVFAYRSASSLNDNPVVNSGGPKTAKIAVTQNALKLKQNLALNGLHISNDGKGDGLKINDDNQVSIPGELKLGGNETSILLRNNNSANGAYLQAAGDSIDFKGDWEFEETLALSPNRDMYTDIVVSRGGSSRYAGGRIRLTGSGNLNQTMYGTLEFANQQQKDLVDADINNLKLGARITSVSHGSPNNTSSTPGNLTFGTTPVGSTSPLPRMTITSEGQVGVNMPATSFGPSSDNNQQYLKNIFSPTETFVVFGDAIYSTGTSIHGYLVVGAITDLDGNGSLATVNTVNTCTLEGSSLPYGNQSDCEANGGTWGSTHQLNTGDQVTITGSHADYNGTHTVTRVNDNTFTFPTSSLQTEQTGSFTAILLHEPFQTSQSHTNVTHTGTTGSGSGMRCSISTDSNGHATFTVTDGGSGYTVGERLTFTDPGSEDTEADLIVSRLGNDNGVRETSQGAYDLVKPRRTGTHHFGSSTVWTSAAHRGARLLFDDGQDGGTITSVISNTILISDKISSHYTGDGAPSLSGSYKIYAPTFKVDSSNGKVQCGELLLSKNGNTNPVSYNGTNFQIENTGRFEVGDTGTYMYQPADGRLGLVSDGDVELTPSAISGKMVKVIKTITSTSAGADYTALSIDLDKSGSSTSNNTIYALKVDADNTTATNGINILYGISNTPTLTHAADAGTVQVTGLLQTVTSSSNGGSTAFGIQHTITGADTNYGIWQKVTDGGTDLKFVSSANIGDYCTVATTTNGATTIATNDADAALAHLTLDPDGDINLNALADVNIPADIGLTFGDAGEKIEGTGNDLIISSSRYLTIDTVGAQLFDSGVGEFNFRDAGDADDAFKITVAGGTGATTLETISDAADGHLSIVADGHVEFDGCAVGFDLITEAFSSDAIANGGSGTGGTHDTDIDFRASNKIYLVVTATMNDMNLIFPATSGNFLLNVRYDGDWDIDSWKVWKSDATASAGVNVWWPGGTEPATTSGGRDIFSFYWDADNEICYGVASLDFQAGN